MLLDYTIYRNWSHYFNFIMMTFWYSISIGNLKIDEIKEK